MKQEHIEKHNALIVLRLAKELAVVSVGHEDLEAAAAAILARALELATPALDAEQRASLLESCD